jgi:hypothetical protein
MPLSAFVSSQTISTPHAVLLLTFILQLQRRLKNNEIWCLQSIHISNTS